MFLSPIPLYFYNFYTTQNLVNQSNPIDEVSIATRTRDLSALVPHVPWEIVTAFVRVTTMTHELQLPS